MDIAAWLAASSEDARRRGLDGLSTLLETLARSTTALRAADEKLREEKRQLPGAGDEDTR